MGTIDSVPKPARATPAHVQAPARKPPVMPQQQSLTAAGAIGLAFGFLLFLWGSLAGLNLLLMGLGGLFMAAAYASRQKPPAKLCPACRMEIPLQATVCGHCRTEQPS